MDTDRVIGIAKGFLTNHLKSMNYFNQDGDHDRKLDLKSVEAAGNGIKVIFVVGETFSIHDPSIRKVARLSIESLCETQPGMKDVEVVHDFTQ